MYLTVFEGQKYSYSYEVETGHYILFKNDDNAHAYLQGDDARIFREEMAIINSLPPPQSNNDTLTENIISIYL